MQFINRAKLDIVLFFQYKQFVNWPLFPQEQTVLQTPEISWPLWHGTRTGMCPTIRSSPNIRVTFSLPCRTILHLMWWHGTETMLRTSMTWRTFASSTLSPTITWWVNALSVNSALHLNTFLLFFSQTLCCERQPNIWLWKHFCSSKNKQSSQIWPDTISLLHALFLFVQ